MSTVPQLQEVGGRNSLGIGFVKNGPKGLVRVLNQLIAGLDRVRLGSSEDIWIDYTGARPVAKLRSLAQRGRYAPANAHPFQVYLTDAAGPKCKVLEWSYLGASFIGSDLTTITDLTTEITLTSSTKIWLKGTVSAGVGLTSAAITTTNPAALVTVSGGAQTEFHVPIGRVVSGSKPTAPGFDFHISGTVYHFEQLVFTHLGCVNICLSTAAGIYPTAWAGPTT